MVELQNTKDKEKTSKLVGEKREITKIETVDCQYLVENNGIISSKCRGIITQKIVYINLKYD